ncbi:hypothetical protein [Mesobacillus maritimus]|nr:hypothetical protein [Mesobacillus maritimus]
MKDIRIISIANEKKEVETGFKVIEVNVSNSSDRLYAVCTPVKVK